MGYGVIGPQKEEVVMPGEKQGESAADDYIDVRALNLSALD